MNMTKICAAIVAITVAPFAQADRYEWFDGDRHSRKKPWAKVINVREVYQEQVERVPIEHCSTKRSRRHSNRGSATPAILGGIIGGAVGNSLGHHNSSKKVGAVVGAVLGASIGHDIGDVHGSGRRYRHRTHKQCETYYEDRVHKSLIGYDVDYRYRGRIYTTHRKQYPGRRIRVNNDWGHHHYRGKKHRVNHHREHHHRRGHQWY